MRRFYLLMCAFGAALPYMLFGPWVLEHGFDLGLLTESVFATPIGAFIALDVLISATAVVVTAARGIRTGNTRMWWPILATLTVGVSFGLPLYYYVDRHGREPV